MNWDNIFYGTVGVVGFMEWLKSFDKKNKLKNFYPLFTLALSFGFGYALTIFAGTFNLGAFIIQSGVIMALSVLGYESIIKAIKGKVDQMKSITDSNVNHRR